MMSRKEINNLEWKIGERDTPLKLEVVRSIKQMKTKLSNNVFQSFVFMCSILLTSSYLKNE